jgi:hypothetical protein
MENQRNKTENGQKGTTTNLEFYNSYFELLATSRTKEDAFNKANEAHFITFGKYRHLCFMDFSNA